MKQQRKKKRSGEPLSYWQSTADMMSALLLILLLVIMLLLLYIIQIPEEEYVDSYPGSYSSSAASSEPEDDWDDDWDGGGWGGWGGGGGGGDGEDDYQYPTPGGGGGTGIGIGFGKTAVYVMVVDAETQATIKEAGITFELYTADGGIQFLNTYYPQKIEYRQYNTTDQGVFYLPEKIFQGDYYLHELNEPDGYDSAGNVSFLVNEDRDWDDPLVVTVPLSPSKNIIRIQMKDADTGEPVSGGVYDVVAAEDIVTKDGTLRYTAGQTVDQITCDAEGYGESIELYLGNYTLVQSTVPQYYAADDGEPLEVSVEKKQSGVQAPIHQIACEKTTVAIQVVDELYPATGLGGATFRLTKSGVGTTTVEADENGQLVLTNLDKGVTYRLRQLTSADSYRFGTEDFVFTVSSDGRVEEEARKEHTITNRLIRVEISVIDRVLRTRVSDANVALYDSQDQRLGMWDSSGLAQSLEGLEPGTYYLVLDGNTGRHIDFEVADTAAVQAINVPVWTMPGVGILTLIVAAAAAIVALLVRWKKNHPGPHLPPPSAALRAAAAKAKALRTAGEAASEGQGTETAPVPAAGPAPDPEKGGKKGKKRRLPFGKRNKADDSAHT